MDSSEVNDDIEDFLADGEEFYFSLYIGIEDKKVNIKRKVYTLLDLLGDVGGLYGALYSIFAGILSTYVTSQYSNSVINNNYDYIAKDSKNKNSAVHNTKKENDSTVANLNRK